MANNEKIKLDSVEAIVARLEEIKTEADSLCKDYNMLYNEEHIELGEIAKCDAKIQKLVSDYTEMKTKLVFSELAKSEDPMLEAAKQLEYEVIATKDLKKGDAKIPVRELTTKVKQIDIGKLYKFVDGGIGVDKTWIHIAQKLNLCLTIKVAEDIGVKGDKIKEINDSYAMSQLAADIKLGKTPCSKTQLLKTLTAIIQAMIGTEYSPNQHDVNFLLYAYGKNKTKNALSIQCANHKAFRQLLLTICHRIVKGEIYGVDYKSKKK